MFRNRSSGRVLSLKIWLSLTSGRIDLLDGESQGRDHVAKLQAVGFSVQQNESLLLLIVGHAVDGKHHTLG